MTTLLAGHYKLVHMARMFFPEQEKETTLKSMLTQIGHNMQRKITIHGEPHIKTTHQNFMRWTQQDKKNDITPSLLIKTIQKRQNTTH